MPGKCKFNTEWLHLEGYKDWLAVNQDPHRADCTACNTTFDISNMGKSALESHNQGKKHQRIILERIVHIGSFYTASHGKHSIFNSIICCR